MRQCCICLKFSSFSSTPSRCTFSPDCIKDISILTVAVLCFRNFIRQWFFVNLYSHALKFSTSCFLSLVISSSKIFSTLSFASSGSFRYLRHTPYTSSIYRWYSSPSISRLPDVLYWSTRILSGSADGIFFKKGNWVLKYIF